MNGEVMWDLILIIEEEKGNSEKVGRGEGLDD